MALTDILIPATALKIGPSVQNPARGAKCKVYYIKSSDIAKVSSHSVNGNAIVFMKHSNARSLRKISLVESPNEFMAAQAQSQGATANAYYAANWQSLTPTSSATSTDLAYTTKYLNDITSGNGLYIRLPDPFTRRLAVVHNQTTGSVLVLGRGTTSPINGSTAAYTIAAGKRVHFTAPTAATAGTTAGWKTATDA